MGNIEIGDWVKREPDQKWHLVESVVAGDATVRCGKRLPDPFAETSKGKPLTRAIGQPQLCKAGCDK